MKKGLVLIFLILISISVFPIVGMLGLLSSEEHDGSKKRGSEEFYIKFYLDNKEKINAKSYELFKEYKITTEYDDEYGIFLSHQKNDGGEIVYKFNFIEDDLKNAKEQKTKLYEEKISQISQLIKDKKISHD